LANGGLCAQGESKGAQFSKEFGGKQKFGGVSKKGVSEGDK